MNDYVFAVDDGDKRMVYLEKMLKDDGYKTASLNDALGGRDVVYCFSPAKKLGVYEAEKLEDGAVIAAGRQPYDILRLFDEKNMRYLNVPADENFAAVNSELTAEAALSIIVAETPRSLAESRLLVTGYGRLAHALCKLFYVLKTDLTIAADNRAERAAAKLFTPKTVDMHTDLSQFDVIINTIPAALFSEFDVSAIRRDAFYLELASVRSISESNVEKYRLDYFEGRGLPGRYSPESAARLIKNTILDLI